MDEEAAEKEFQSEELQEIEKLPDQERRAQVRIAVVDLKERILGRKPARQRHQIDERQHYRDALKKKFDESAFDPEREADLAELSFLNEPNEQSGNDEIERHRHKHPPDQSVEIVVGRARRLDADAGKRGVHRESR